MSQNIEILKRLRKGDIITPFDALKGPKIRSMRLAARIKDLREAGEKIETIRVYNGDRAYAAYKRGR